MRGSRAAVAAAAARWRCPQRNSRRTRSPSCPRRGSHVLGVWWSGVRALCGIRRLLDGAARHLVRVGVRVRVGVGVGVK
eukprot:scaffold104435_cov48-Phaeocystis_antarctica.AAC.1